MSRFVSEPITPVTDDQPIDTDALARGEPSLPGAFRWRGQTRQVLRVLATGRGLRRESFSGENYLHRHEWRLLMDGDEIWFVYFTRQAKRQSPKRATRWFLKKLESAGEEENPA